MERVLMLAGDAAEELEVYYILYRLREAGYAVDVAAPKRGLMHLVVHDFEEGWDTYVERPGYQVESDMSFDEVRAKLLDAGRDLVDTASLERLSTMAEGLEGVDDIQRLMSIAVPTS